MSVGATDLRIGTSGWNYPSGRGTWNGVFYPPSRGRAKGFDELSFYAQHFNTVEVNSTFYGQPRADVTRGWAERTPPGFEFSIKLYQKFTHPKMFKTALTKGMSAGEKDDFLDALSRPNQPDLDDFRRGIDPLASAGKLGALLAQFPPSFKDSPASRDYLLWLLRAFVDYRVAVELRHSSWSDAIGDTLALLNRFGSAWVQIDEPCLCLDLDHDAEKLYRRAYETLSGRPGLPNLMLTTYFADLGANLDLALSIYRWDFKMIPLEKAPCALIPVAALFWIA